MKNKILRNKNRCMDVNFHLRLLAFRTSALKPSARLGYNLSLILAYTVSTLP